MMMMIMTMIRMIVTMMMKIMMMMMTLRDLMLLSGGTEQKRVDATHQRLILGGMSHNWQGTLVTLTLAPDTAVGT